MGVQGRPQGVATPPYMLPSRPKGATTTTIVALSVRHLWCLLTSYQPCMVSPAPSTLTIIEPLPHLM